jgi:hypothetical protein
METMKYQLTKNGEVLATGTFDECWTALLKIAGPQTLADVEAAGYRIEAAE